MVEGPVGRPHQAAALDVQARECRNAGGRGDRPAVRVVRGGDAAEHRRGDLERHRLIPAGQQQRELVAPEPERLAAMAQAACDLDEDAVAGGMAVAVVDALEVVDVDDAERKRKALLVSSVEVALEALEEMPRVAEPGERVGQRELHRLDRRPHVQPVEDDGDERRQRGCGDEQAGRRAQVAERGEPAAHERAEDPQRELRRSDAWSTRELVASRLSKANHHECSPG